MDRAAGGAGGWRGGDSQGVSWAGMLDCGSEGGAWRSSSRLADKEPILA